MDDETPEHDRPRHRTGLLIVLKVAVSAALLAVLLSRVDLSQLWSHARTASVPWLAAALGFYLVMVLGSAWRWGLLLAAQRVHVPFGALTSSFLVATFFNNFLPSNIGGDVVRVGDTARQAGSKTLAATVVLIDRAIGLLGLVLIAALGATAARGLADEGAPVGALVLWAGFGLAAAVSAPAVLMPEGVGRLLQPLAVFHPEWVGERIGRLTGALARFRERPSALVACFAGAVAVQAVLVLFYVAIAWSLAIPISAANLAVIVPLSFVVQMLPVSMNGFGVREAVFGFYFTRLGLPLESGLLVSFMGAMLIMLFSVSGAAVYVARRRR